MLWQASARDLPVVLLIDEIDKATSSSQRPAARARPYGSSTSTRRASFEGEAPADRVHHSNNEKELPDAFLRRCFSTTSASPTRRDGEIVACISSAEEVAAARGDGSVLRVREVPGLKKKPSTSELLDWLKAAAREDIPPDALRSKDRKRSFRPCTARCQERAGRASVRAPGLHDRAKGG